MCFQGLAGKTDVEEAVVDSLADQFKDIYSSTVAYFIAVLKIYPEPQEKVDELYKTYEPAKNRLFTYFTKYLKKSKTGFLAGGDLTYVDLILVEYITSMRTALPNLTNGFDEVFLFIRKLFI